MTPQRRRLLFSTPAAAAPALPTIRSIGTYVAGIGDVTPGLPADRQPDDWLMLLVGGDAADWLTGNPANPALPAGGWAIPRSAFSPPGVMPTTGSGTTGARIAVFGARSSDIASAPTITGMGNHTYAVIIVWKGVKAGADPYGVDAVGGTGSQATTLTVPGITTPSPNCRVVYVVADPGDSTTPFLSAESNANLTDLTEHIDVGTSSGNGGRVAVVSGAKATPGASGDLMATIAGAPQLYRTITLCLEAA